MEAVSILLVSIICIEESAGAACTVVVSVPVLEVLLLLQALSMEKNNTAEKTIQTQKSFLINISVVLDCNYTE